MIAEFNLDGKEVTFEFQYNPNAFARDWDNRPNCDYCHQKLDGTHSLINPGGHPGGTLMPGWARVDGKMLSGPIGEGDQELHRRIVAEFRSRLFPKIVHENKSCLEAWMRDENAHPWLHLRWERHKTKAA